MTKQTQPAFDQCGNPRSTTVQSVLGSKKLAIGTSFGQVDIVNPETGEKILWLSDNLNGETVSRTKRVHPYPEQGADDDAARALARLKELRRAMGNVASIAFTSDGSWLVTSGGSFEDQPLEFDFAGQVPASKTGPGRVKVWNVETGKRKYNFDHHLHAESIAFSGNTRSRNEYFDCLLATAGIWGTGDKRFSGVRLWRMGDGNLVQELRNEDEDFPNAIAFSPDSVLLAIGLRHKTNANGETCGIVRMVKPLAGGEVWEQKVPISARKIVFIASGKMLAVLCGRPGQARSIQLLDANTGKLNRELKLSDLDHGGAWLDFTYSASEQLLIAVGFDKQQRGSIDVWDFENRRDKD